MARPLSDFLGWHLESTWPSMACPTCGHGALRVKELSAARDAKSARLHASYDLIGPSELDGTFAGHLRCDDNECDEMVAVAGDWRLVFNGSRWRDDDASMIEEYRVRYVSPALHLVELPSQTPVTVQTAVSAASAVFWTNPAAAAGRLRNAVEALLTARRIPRTRVTSKGKRVVIPLDQRITNFGSTHPEVAETLRAVKWVGNDGAHDEHLTHEQVLLGACIFEVAVKALYDKTEADLLAKVRRINKTRRAL